MLRFILTKRFAIIAAITTVLVVLGDVTGITSGNYRQAANGLSVIVFEAPDEEQVQIRSNQLRQQFEGSDLSESEARAAIGAGMQIASFPDELTSYILMIRNDSDVDLENVAVDFAFRKGSETVFSRDAMESRNISGGGGFIKTSVPKTSIPKTGVDQTFSRIDVCIWFRGQYFVNYVVLSMSIDPVASSQEPAPEASAQSRIWGLISNRSLERFVFLEPCVDFPGA